MLEKGPEHKRGGNSFFTDGAIRFAFNGLEDIRAIMPEMTDEEAANIYIPPYNTTEYLKDLMRVTGGKSTPELAEQLVTKSYETIAWMKSHGINFQLIYDNQSFEKGGIHHFWGGLPVKTENKGVGLIQHLNARAKQLGIEIWYESRAYKLCKENNQIVALPVDKEQFLQTIKKYNDSVQEGSYNPTEKDGKGTKGITPPKSNWALRIEKGPFYVFPVTCGITFSFGGVHANSMGEVLDENREAINGLFVAGEMIGGIFYGNYPGGSGLMSGAVFGKLAGTSAAEYAIRRVTVKK